MSLYRYRTPSTQHGMNMSTLRNKERYEYGTDMDMDNEAQIRRRSHSASARRLIKGREREDCERRVSEDVRRRYAGSKHEPSVGFYSSGF